MTEISTTLFDKENKESLKRIIRRLQQGKLYYLRIDGTEEKFLIKHVPKKKSITERMISSIKNEAEKFIKMIANITDSNIKNAKITYYCFVFNILDDFEYHHYIDSNGKTRMLNPTSFCKIFELRRATLQQELNPISKAKARKGKKKYSIHDTSYRCLKLDDYKVSNNDSDELIHSIHQLKPIYNKLIDTIISI